MAAVRMGGRALHFLGRKVLDTPSQKSSAMSSQTLVKVVDLGWGISLAVR